MQLQRVAEHQGIAHELLRLPDVPFLVRPCRHLVLVDVAATTPLVVLWRPKRSHEGVTLALDGLPPPASSRRGANE